MSFATAFKMFGVQQALNYLQKNPRENLLKLMDWSDKFSEGTFPEPRKAIREALTDPNHPYHNFIDDLFTEVDEGVRNTLLENFFVNATLGGWKRQEEMRETYDCNIPWTILLDPTSACNLRCTGCWAAEYGNKLNLTYDEIDDIINQGKEMGVYMYIYTGGEPLVRKRDLIKLCEVHNDCVFLCFTNGTLIDEHFAKEMLRVQNFVPAISLEGFEETTDLRRGEGTFGKVMEALKILKENKLVYGISTCYTSANFESIVSEEFYDTLIELGCYFLWLFHYMPVGNNATLDLLPTPEQRRTIYETIRKFRKEKPLFAMDFQNDAEYVRGCIAGGHRYLHINANGDIEPCVFIHYSDSNIREKTLLEALQSPMLMQYHDNIPFNDNMLRPCPMLENPGRLRRMVNEAGAESTDLESPETVEHLCDKCIPYAKNWMPYANKLWAENPKSTNQ